MQIRATIARHPRRYRFLGLVLAAAVAFAVYWFGPQYLFIDRRVNEALPSVAPAVVSPAPGPSAAPASPASGPGEFTTLAAGEFRRLEHDATGRALIVELADGSRFLRLEDLSVSNGPDLRVILSPASSDSEGFSVWGQGSHDLGPLKGNVGSSNYEIPAGLDLSRYRSAVVWCRRFTVGFAVAPVEVSG